jgi:hypothetical protein
MVLLVMSIAYAASAPYGPTSIDVVSSTRRTSFGSGSQSTQADAGNVTQLIIETSTVTKRWQGYYGNITGSVTLDDANNWTMFDWGDVPNPKGEVYAANATVSDWSTIRCINLSSTYPGHNCTGQNEACLNVTEIENAYGMTATDSDGVDETFNETLGSITVGTVTVNNCPMVNLYVNSSKQSTYYWNETMLTINNTETIIYASIIHANTYGFNNKTWDFQMIVGDNGDDSLTTTYNFYIELS